MSSEGYGSRRLCVCLSVCLSVCVSDLILEASLRPENAVTYSVGNEGQKIVAFSLTLRRSRATALAALYGHSAVGHFLSAEYARALQKCYVDSEAEFGQPDCHQLSLRFS